MMKHVALVLALVACGNKKYEPSDEELKEQKAAEELKNNPPPKAPPPKKLTMPTDFGTCHLTASGAVTADQTLPGTKTSTNVSYWYAEKERKSMMGVDGFVVNCNGENIRFTMIPGGGKMDGMPFKPKKYDFVKGKGDASLNVGFGKAAMTGISGAVDVTAFDAHHIAGTVDVAGKLSPGGGDVKLTGTFDFVCPGISGCEAQ